MKFFASFPVKLKESRVNMSYNHEVTITRDIKYFNWLYI